MVLMSASRVAVLAAFAAVVAWALKAVAIGVAGGLDESPLEGPLFVLGLIAVVVAFAALGVAVMAGRARVLKVVAAVVGVLVGLALTMLTSVVAESAIPDAAGWVQAEAGLWFTALVALGATLFWRTRQPEPQPRSR